MWHASVARQRRTLRGSEPLETSLWLPGDRAVALRIAQRVLADVGDPQQEHREVGDLAVHVRRACTPAEIAALPEGTLARRVAMGFRA